jgi:uncharacterized protein YndB with AHSA1/START domain
MKRLLAAAAISMMLMAPPAGAADAFPDWRAFRDVSNSSFVEPGGGRVLQLSIVVNAPPKAVWDAFTTSEGFTTWAVPVAWVDLRVGGLMESSYLPSARAGDAENIKNQIVAYVPGRLLSIRNIQTPSGLKHRELFGQVVQTIEFDDVGASRTRVTMTGVGWGPGEGFDYLYRHFEWGNAYSLAELKKRFDTGPVDWTAVFERQKAAAATAVVQGGH